MRAPRLLVVALAYCAALLLAAETAFAQDARNARDRDAPVTDTEEELEERGEVEDRWAFIGFPILSYNTDEGIGLGGVLSLHHYAGGVQPFRDDISLRLFLTSNLVQRHELRWESIEAFDLPLRFRVAAGLYSTLTQNFCGFGSVVTCDPALAERAADERGLGRGSETRAAFVRRFYKERYIQPYFDALFRVRVSDMPHRVELFGGWRLAYHLPGQLGDLEPYRGSLYSRVFPLGEEGLLSTPQLGVVVDDRDFEPWPTRGYFFEASVRGSGPFTASRWTYGGVNSSLAGYFRIARVPQTVLATRLLADLLAGEVPTEALARSVGLLDAYAFGGQWLGRGIRERRYIGKIKLIQQAELRTMLANLDINGTELDVALAWFWDLAFVGYDWDNLAGFIPGVHDARALASPRLLVGLGGGARILLNKTFVIRLDVAVSPNETLGPYLYTPVGNPF